MATPISSLPFPIPSTDAGPIGEWETRDGTRCYRIEQVQHLDPFLINLVSASDLWMYVASNGALTAGRRDADGALFPYQTVDRIYDSAGAIGPFTVIAIDQTTEDNCPSEILWEPFLDPNPHRPGLTRSLAKSREGDRLYFDETRADLGLEFGYSWTTADDHGFIRRCRLHNRSDHPVRLRLLDGLRNLLPAGIPQRLQQTSSNLTDAYKTAERQPDSTGAVFALTSIIVDQPVPREALRATVVWSGGLPDATLLLSDRQLPAFRAGLPLQTESRTRGQRHAYLLATTLELAPGESHEWFIVADTELSHPEVVDRLKHARGANPAHQLTAAERTATRQLRRLVGAADGCQSGGDEIVTAHHFANVLFNIMRGGTFVDGHQIPTDDFLRHVAIHNRPVADRHTSFLSDLPARLDRSTLLQEIAPLGDPDLNRIAGEYLPLLFSRRHGDPSRPWNRFSIRLRDGHGGRRLAYEGNWRDIFQNWEALCLSYPAFLDAVVAKFLNASTVDGYNPYRLSNTGIDWEAPEADNPWASIGYWGDHQVVYLLKLLEWSARISPAVLPATLRDPQHSYADVPYRIVGYDAMRADPRQTIDFDLPSHRQALARAERLGADGLLRPTKTGEVRRASLTEKLLLLALVRLTNFIPGGGIWMNTQRPEWNDANNALVGYGVSVVTLAYLRRFLNHVRQVLWSSLGDTPVPVTGAVAELARTVSAILQTHASLLETPIVSPAQCRQLVDALAHAGTRHRERVYADDWGPEDSLAPSELIALFEQAQAFVDHSLRANRRADQLFHTYNQLQFNDAPAELHLQRLPLMLEGQVAVLSSGMLAPAEALAMLQALRTSPLHRADLNTYLLYPDRELPSFLERNHLTDEAAATCPLLADLEAAGDQRLVQRDASGSLRFHADLANAGALRRVLAELATDPRWQAAATAQTPAIEALYENVFHHRSFTGRSGSMFGFEGLGCTYWHMVAKLLLAVQEVALDAQANHSPDASALVRAYYDVRSGLGFNHSPDKFGAFPSDPYSHTPGHAGAQQPGMTGQVKEEVLTRLGELGVTLAQSQITFAPTLLRALEFAAAPSRFSYVDHAGTEQTLDLPAHSLAFTFAGTPIIYQRHDGGTSQLHVHRADSVTAIAGPHLPPDSSADVLQRTGRIHHIVVEFGRDVSFLA